MKRDIQSVDDDIVRKKRIIERKLYEDPDIIEILDDPDVDPDCPEEIIYSSIYPCIIKCSYIVFQLIIIILL